jgi:hypothetical protein
MHFRVNRFFRAARLSPHFDKPCVRKPFDFILVEATTHTHDRRYLVPIRLMNMPLWLYFRSVSSSEKSVKL